MRILPLAFVLALAACNGTTLVESADVPTVDVALDFNPGDARTDVAGCPPGFTCTPLDASVDAGQFGTDVAPVADVSTGCDPNPCPLGTTCHGGFCLAGDGGGDVPGDLAVPLDVPLDVGGDVVIDTGVDMPPVDTGVDVVTSCVSMTVGNCNGMACTPGLNVATAACVACQCGIGTCTTGYGDCDHMVSDGCETNLNTDPMNCGGCGVSCAAGTTCSGRVCGVTCASPLVACGSMCRAIATDPAHCGSCSTACAAPTNGVATCTSGTCGFSCNTGYANCGTSCVATATGAANCGSCDHICAAPTNGTAICTSGACVITCNSGYMLSGGSCVAPAPPRPIAPLSTATVTSQTPTLHWALPIGTDSAHVQVCHDRACATVEQTFDASGASGTVTTALTPGVHYWRLASRSGGVVGTMWSSTWEFFVGTRSAPADTSWGTVADFNGDGFADVVVGAAEGNPGAAYVYLGSASGLSATPITLTGGPPGNNDFGCSVASAGDVNGDGFADLVVGAGSAAYVYLGSASGLSATPIPIAAWPGPAGSDQFGYSVASAGDVNGDGFADVVVGAVTSGTFGSNTAYVYLGSVSGLSTIPTTITGPVGSSDFGISVASAGDVNGDGFADVVVGAIGSNTAYVYLGSASGLSTVPITLTGPVASYFGLPVASAGDVNGDGFADVVVGAAGNIPETGTAYVYLGSASGLSTIPITRTGPAGTRDFGESVASAGDVNGDGFADVVVGANGSSTAYVYLGSASGLSTVPITLTGPAGTRDFGESVACAGDVNGDGFADVVIGTYSFGASGSNTAYVYLGSAGGLSRTPATTLTGPSGSGFGASVASVDQVREQPSRNSSGPLGAS